MSGKPRVHRRRTSNRHLLPPTRRSLEFPLPGKPPCPIVTSITRPQAWESGGMSHKRYEARLLSSLRRSTSHSEFMPVIDGLRFLAILPVVLQHLCERAIRIAEDRHLATASDYALINLFPTGYLGVELFFVMSGFIISYPFISAYFRGQRNPSVRISTCVASHGLNRHTFW